MERPKVPGTMPMKPAKAPKLTKSGTIRKQRSDKNAKHNKKIM